MSNKLYEIFDEVESQANTLSNNWQSFYSEILGYLPAAYQRDIQELSERLERARTKLINELRNPVLTLATTGTTSSGKSTLVNFLCGVEIVPVAVKEKSAGIVTIEYSKEKSLVIHETPNAEWECGKWYDIHEDEIYERLNEVMERYIASRERNPSLACPRSVIGFPVELLKESNLELPRGTKVRIMDLPGLSYVGDEGNANVIKQCKEALCIVAYNSEETDPLRIKALLQEVVAQVKLLRGSPARMLFVLNKIDVYRRDRDWTEESENLWVKKTLDSIKTELYEQLPEHTKEIDNLQVVKLSTWPALLSLQIQNSDEKISTTACEKSEEHFNGLIKDVLKKLSRDVTDWSLFERNKVARSLQEKSYAQEFQEHLENHITTHFPKLVIPQMLERFDDGGGNAVAEWVIQTTSAILNSSEEGYLQECQNILQIRADLKQFLVVSDARLRKPFESVAAKMKQPDNDPIADLQTIISEFKNSEPYKTKLGESLYPLYAWSVELKKGITQVLEAVAESLESGSINLDGMNLKKADRRSIKFLESNLSTLISLGYTGSIAKQGTTREARTSDETEQLKRLNAELNLLGNNLSLVMEQVLEQICKQELNRIHEALVKLFDCHLEYLEMGSNKVAKNMAIKFPKSQLIKVEKQPDINFKLKSGFLITAGTWQEKVATEITVERAIERNTQGKWGWNWLKGVVGVVGDVIIKRELYKETYIDYVQRPSDNAKIPSVKDLLSSWIFQAQTEEVKIANQIINWFLEEIEDLKKSVGQIQDDVVNRYQERLDKANQEITSEFEETKSIWVPLGKKAHVLAEEFSSFTKILSGS